MHEQGDGSGDELYRCVPRQTILSHYHQKYFILSQAIVNSCHVIILSQASYWLEYFSKQFLPFSSPLQKSRSNAKIFIIRL